MENSKEKKPEEILSDKLIEAEQIGKEIASQGRNITKEGQWIADLARATRGISENAPQLLDIEAQIYLWEGINYYGRASLQGLHEVESSLSLTSGSADISSTSVIHSTSSIGSMLDTLPLQKYESTRIAIDNFQSMISRKGVKEEVVSLMKLYGFDRGIIGKMSPLDLFLTAHDAFERPVSESDPVNTSLIPMRESIRSIIADLLRRRPKQEETSNEYKKIYSIGKQLKRDELRDDFVGELANQWVKWVDELSGTKQSRLSREEWRQLLQGASLFLAGLLKGLDPSKVNR